MPQKTPPKPSATAKKPPRKRDEPRITDVRLTVNLKYGNAPDERVLLIDDQTIPLVGSVFQYREVIFKFLVSNIGKTAVNVVLPSTRFGKRIIQKIL